MTDNTASAPLLEAKQVTVKFEGLAALEDVDLVLKEHEILGFIGPNGAGKTTFVNTLTGFQRVTTGQVFLEGDEVTNVAAHRLARRGVARTFQGAHLFAGLTVLENIEASGVGVGGSRRESRRRAWQILEQMGRGDLAHVPAGSLPHGEERRLGMARALVTHPKVLILDEPAAGLNESESDELLDTISGWSRDYGCSILLIEHDMRLIMRLCDRVQVIDHGKTIAVGTPGEVRADDAVIEAYLGRKRSGANAGG
jgi:branched-chain amino acid transport system ATP-binding protein